MSRRKVRDEMVSGAVRLLATKGLQGTSFAEVLALVDAPRGSVYHHFPGGKQELISAAVLAAGDHALVAMESAHGLAASVVVGRFIELWRQLLLQSRYRAGCSVLAVTVGTDDPDLLAQAALIFSSWSAQLAELLAQGGVAQNRASSLAATVIAACEGAVAMSRAERDDAPFELMAAEIMLATEMATAASH